VVYNLTHKIIYQPSQFGIYGIESLRVVECMYAIQYSKITGADVVKSFLIKTGRRPNQSELDYINRVFEGEKAPTGVYQHNWIVYSSQNLSLKHPYLLPSTREVREITENTFGHRVNNDIVNLVAALSSNKVYSLQGGYYGVNIWQPIEICCALDSAEVERNDTAIRLLFNKIYKRDPIPEEILICKSLQLTTPQEIQNEIEQIVKVRNKGPVSSRSPR